MFDSYRKRVDFLGGNIRDSIKRQSVQISESLFSNSTSVRNVIVNGETVEAKITTDSKTTVRGGNGNYLIQFREDFNPKPGTYVEIPDHNNNYEPWLILYESDDTQFRKHIIKKCNYFLRWKNQKGEIIERWTVFGDNSRIQDGEYYTAYNKMALPRIMLSLILPCDKETINISIGQRFIVDFSYVEGSPDAWRVSNRNVISKTFNDLEGVIELAINKHQFNHLTDSKEEMIADFYKNYDLEQPADRESNFSCRIIYNGNSDLKMGTPFKNYTAEVYEAGELFSEASIVWNVLIPEEVATYFTYEIDENKFKIKCKYNAGLIGSHIRLVASTENGMATAELPIKVVSSI